MSLVNDMLKDLDRRQRSDARASVRINSAMNTSTESGGRHGLLIAGGLVLGLLAGVGGAYLLMQQEPVTELSIQSVPLQISNDRLPSTAPPRPAAGSETSTQDNTMAQAAETAGEVQTPVPLPTQPPQVQSLNTVSDEQGFRLVLGMSEAVNHQITAQSERNLNLRLPATVLSGASASLARNIQGLRIYEVDGALNVNLTTGQDAHFELASDSTEGAHTLTIQARYRQQSSASTVLSQQESELLAPLAELPAQVGQSSSNAQGAEATASPAREVGRSNRELSLRERDQANRQQALRLLQGGQLLEAIQILNNFIENNLEAHLSRETLATLLLAQGELLQASLLVEQGLSLAPNRAGYKKLQARLLLVDERPEVAINLLERLPPRIQDDYEYFELLASIHQRVENHDKAIAIYQDLLRADASQSRWWTGMGISHEALGNMDLAVGSYETALRGSNLDPGLQRYSRERLEALRR